MRSWFRLLVYLKVLAIAISNRMKISQSYIIETQRCRLRCVSLEDIPHTFSATQYQGFNDGMLWEPPTKEEELIEPYQRSIISWENGEAYTFTIESKDSKNFRSLEGARLCAPTINTSFSV
ncbi:MAG: hypothetical protein CLLPBCKN_007951 [Chroococcidiopsis cubana SAG 39.79]|nr:hypothetical protein [Chroococcidiopsis cubana SAG 39.79]